MRSVIVNNHLRLALVPDSPSLIQVLKNRRYHGALNLPPFFLCSGIILALLILSKRVSGLVLKQACACSVVSSGVLQIRQQHWILDKIHCRI